MGTIVISIIILAGLITLFGFLSSNKEETKNFQKPIRNNYYSKGEEVKREIDPIPDGVNEIMNGGIIKNKIFS